MIARIVTTVPPLDHGAIPDGKPRRVPDDVLAATLAGPGRDRLASGAVLAVTTGQQPGLFTGPLYTIHKAISAIVVARRLESLRGVPVVPVFWVAGDDHDFAEGNHAWVLGKDGEPVRIVVRERAHEAPQLPLFREPCGQDAATALNALTAALPDSEFKAEVTRWLEQAYRADTNLADAAAQALNTVLAPQGLAVFRAHDRAAKRAAAPLLLRGLDESLDDGLSPVLVEGRLGRDRLKKEGAEYVTRRGGERFTKAQLEQVAHDTPERLSPNVLLRPVVEAALFPTVAYLGGPGEMEYLPESGPLFSRLGVTPQKPVRRWSGTLIESRVDKVLKKHGLQPGDFTEPPGALEARLARADMPAELADALEKLRDDVATRFQRISGEVQQIDPTLERTVESARNAALAGTHEIEKKLVASLKRSQGTALGQLARARSALAPNGKPQERVLTLASFMGRYGSSLLTEIETEVSRWAGAAPRG